MIFVFREALPVSVCALAFVVERQRPCFSEIPGASWHVSDRITECEWIRLDPTTLGKHEEHRVATMRRCLAGWQRSRVGQPMRARQQTPYEKEADHADL